jgi:hypothetical protein
MPNPYTLNPNALVVWSTREFIDTGRHSPFAPPPPPFPPTARPTVCPLLRDIAAHRHARTRWPSREGPFFGPPRRHACTPATRHPPALPCAPAARCPPRIAGLRRISAACARSPLSHSIRARRAPGCGSAAPPCSAHPRGLRNIFSTPRAHSAPQRGSEPIGWGSSPATPQSGAAQAPCRAPPAPQAPAGRRGAPPTARAPPPPRRPPARPRCACARPPRLSPWAARAD